MPSPFAPARRVQNNTTSSGLGPIARKMREDYANPPKEKAGRMSDPEQEQGPAKSEILTPKRMTHFRAPDGALKPIKSPSGASYVVKSAGWTHPRDPETDEPVIINEKGEAKSIYDTAPITKSQGSLWATPAGYPKKRLGPDPDFNSSVATEADQKAQLAKQKADEKEAKAIVDENLDRVQFEVNQIDTANELQTIATKREEAKAKLVENDTAKELTVANAKLKDLEDKAKSGLIDATTLTAARADLEAKKTTAEAAASNTRTITARALDEDFKRATEKQVMSQNLEQVKLLSTGRRAAASMPAPAPPPQDAAKAAPTPSKTVSLAPASPSVQKAHNVITAPDIQNSTPPTQAEVGIKSPFGSVRADASTPGHAFDTPAFPDLDYKIRGKADVSLPGIDIRSALQGTHTKFIPDADSPDGMGWVEPPDLNKPARLTKAEKQADKDTPTEWTTPEAVAAQQAAHDIGADSIHVDDKISIKMPAPGYDKKGGLSVEGREVGTIRYTKHGTPEIELATTARGQTASPSYRSDNPFGGAPEWAAPSADHIEAVTADAEANDAEPKIGESWEARRMPEAEFSEMIENWNGAGDFERRKLMDSATLKSMESEMPNARQLYRNGVLSLQQARQLDQAVYGRRPVLPPAAESFAAWKDGDSEAAKKLRDATQGGALNSTDRQDVAMQTALINEWADEYFKRHGDQPDFDAAAFHAEREKIASKLGTPLQRLVAGIESTGENVAGSIAGMIELADNASPQGIARMAKLKAAPDLDPAKISAVQAKKAAGQTLTTEEKRIDFLTQFAGGKDVDPTVITSTPTAQKSEQMWNTMVQGWKNGTRAWMKEDDNPMNRPVIPHELRGTEGADYTTAYATEKERADAHKDYLAKREAGTTSISGDIDWLREQIDNETLTAASFKQRADIIKAKATKNLGIASDEAASIAKLTKLNPQLTPAEIKAHYDETKASASTPYDVTAKSAAASLLVAYSETRDPSYLELLKDTLHETTEGQQVAAGAAAWASKNGMIQESDFLSVFNMSRRGIQLDVNEALIEMAGDVTLLGAAKAFTSTSRLLKASGKAGQAVTRMGRAASKADKLLDLVKRTKDDLLDAAKTVGTKPGATGRNMAVGALKTNLVATGTEGGEEAMSAQLQEAKNLRKTLDQTLQGAAGGLFMGVLGTAAGAGLNALDTLAQNAQRTQAAERFTKQWNRHNATQPITVDDAKSIRSLINPADIGQIVADRRAVVDEISATEGPPSPDQQQRLIGSYMAEESIIRRAKEAHDELGGVGDEKMRNFIKASMRVITGQPLTSKDQLAMQAVNAAGQPLVEQTGAGVTWTDAGLAEVAQAAPGIRRTYFPVDQDQQETDILTRKIQDEQAQGKGGAPKKQLDPEAQRAADILQQHEGELDKDGSYTMPLNLSNEERAKLNRRANSVNILLANGYSLKGANAALDAATKAAQDTAPESELSNPDAVGSSQEQGSEGDRKIPTSPAKGQSGETRSNSPSSKAGGPGSIPGSGTTVDEAAHAAATSPTNDKAEPTDAQKEAGNYPVGKINVSGLRISIESPVGSVRKGKNKNGKAWTTTMQAHYGYLRNTIGADGDHIDTFVKQGTTEDFDGDAYVIPQYVNGKFDEHKVMIGYSSVDEAKKAYKAHYEKGWEGYRPAMRVPMSELAAMVKSGKLKKPTQRTRTNEPSSRTTTVSNTAGNRQSDSNSRPATTGSDIRPAPASQGRGDTGAASSGVDTTTSAVPVSRGNEAAPGADSSSVQDPGQVDGLPSDVADSGVSGASATWTIRTTKGRKLSIPATEAKDEAEAIHKLAQQTNRNEGELLVRGSLAQPAVELGVVQQIYDIITTLAQAKGVADAKFTMNLGAMIAVAVKKHMPTLEASFEKIKIVKTYIKGGGMAVDPNTNTLIISPSTLIKSLQALPAKDMAEFIDRGFFHEYLHAVINHVVDEVDAAKFWNGLTPQAQDEFKAAYSQGGTTNLGSDSSWGHEFLRAYLENRFGKGISEEMFLSTSAFRHAVDLIKRIIARLTNIQTAIAEGADKEWMLNKVSEVSAAYIESRQNIETGNVDAQRNAKQAKAKAKPIGSSQMAKTYVNDQFGAMLKEAGVELVPNFSSISAHYVVSEGGKRRGGYIEYNPMRLAEWSPGQISDAMREEIIHALEDKALLAETLKRGYKMSDSYIQSGQYHIDFFAGVHDMMTPEQIKYVKSIYTSHGNKKYVIGSEFRRMVMQREHYGGITEQAMAGNKTPAKANAALEAVASLFSAALSILKKMMFVNSAAGRQARKIYDAAKAELQRIDPRGEAKPLMMAGPPENSKVVIYDNEFGATLPEVMASFKRGEILVHARRASDAGDLKNGLEPTSGDTLATTEAFMTYEEYGMKPVDLVFASDTMKWAGGSRDAVVFVRKDRFQKSMGDGKVMLPDGKIVRYELSPVADYENESLKGEPFGVETGDWYSTKTADVVAVAPFAAIQPMAAPSSRESVTKGEQLTGDGRSFAKFFASVTQGAEDKYKPTGDYRPAIKLDPASKAFQFARYKFRGNFDDHIATSIPGFDEVQAVVGTAIVKTFGDEGAVMLDIGASEGALNKAITSLTRGAIKTLAIDPNTSMEKTFKSKGSVKGADFDLSAFGSKEEAGTTAWTEDDGTEIKFFDPLDHKFDVVHEAMVFQFISNARNAQVKRVKELMKPSGIAIFEQKFGDRKDVFDANENKKDLDWKSRHYTMEQLEQKRQAVLNSGGDQVEGMTALQVAHWEMEEVLKSNFKHVVQFWSSGNFRGYVGSDSSATLSKFVANLQSTQSEFATQDTPRVVSGELTPMIMPYAESAVRDLGKLSHAKEGGDTLNLDGSKYTGGGVAIPVLSKNVDDYKAMRTSDIGQFINPDNIEYVAAGGSVLKAGIYKFPNSNKASIDLNIIAPREMRDEGVKIAGELGQESAFDLDSFENIKTGADGMNPRKPTVDEVREIAARLQPMAAPSAQKDSEYLAAVERGDMTKAQAMVDERLAEIGAMWHGTPSGDLRGGRTGLHVGTRQAAMEALEARIGIPADGKGWNGDREYGETLLAGKDRINSGEFGKYRLSGFNTDAPKEDYFPSKMPTVGESVPVDPKWKPWLRPVMVVGEMTNNKWDPISDAAANRRIKRKRGAYYTNTGEDSGSISAVLPDGEHVRVKLADPVTRDESGQVIPLSQRFNPVSDSILYMAAPADELNLGRKADPEMMRQKNVKRIVEKTAAAHPEAMKVEYVKDGDKFRLDEKGLPQPVPQEYSLLDSTLARTAAKGRRGDARRNALTIALADKLLGFFNSIKGDADIMNGKEWYRVARQKLVKVFGPDTLIFSQLLAATSARTPVQQNFEQALDAYNQMRNGNFDGVTERYLDAMKRMEAGELTFRKSINGKAMGETVTPKSFRDWLDAEEILPRRSNGKKYNANSMQVLNVIAGVWREKLNGPKTAQFSDNLSGASMEATIDVWAARTLHRLSNEQEGARWRILPEAETGVNNEDFAIGQAAFKIAAQQLGMNPDDLQGVLWFAEKRHWTSKGWTRAAGSELSDFSSLLDFVKTEGDKLVLRTNDNQGMLGLQYEDTDTTNQPETRRIRSRNTGAAQPVAGGAGNARQSAGGRGADRVAAEEERSLFMAAPSPEQIENILPGAEYLSPRDAFYEVVKGPVIIGAFHGTTHAFDKFTNDRGEAGNNFGKAIYATTSLDDVNANYAGVGPDITNRINDTAERIQSENEFSDHTTSDLYEFAGSPPADSPLAWFNSLTKKKQEDIKAKYEKKNAISKEEAIRLAMDELTSHGGAIVPLWIPSRNPLVLDKAEGDTKIQLRVDRSEYHEDAVREVMSDRGMTREEAEESDYLYEEIDRLADGSDNIDKLKGIVDSFDGTDWGKLVDDIGYDNETINASDLEEILRTSEGTIYAEDDDGNMVNGELVRQVFMNALGYDAIIDRNVADKFKSMKGLNASVHIILDAEGPNRPVSALSPDHQFMAAPQPPNFVEPGFYSELRSVIASKMPGNVKTQPARTVPGRASPERTIIKDGRVLKVIKASQEPDKSYPARTTAEQIKALLESADVTQEEIKWSGIATWLEGRESVTKAELLDYLDTEGSVRFKETWLNNEPSPEAMTELARARKAFAEAKAKLNMKYGSDQDIVRNNTSDEIREMQMLKYKMQAAELAANRSSMETKYAAHTLPGGKNYREIVLTQPMPESRIEYEIEEMRYDNGTVKYFAKGPNFRSSAKATRADAEAELAKRRVDYDKIDSSAQSYTSSHFSDIPNYVAHMRLDDRTDAAGKQGTMIQELQSDRHQAGRKDGYAGDKDKDTTGWTAVRLNPGADWNHWQINDASGNEVAKAVGGSAEEAIKTIAKPAGGVPDAPYRSSWNLALFKRALRDAVENGMEWIGWTTGDTQNERYGLEKHLSKVTLQKPFGPQDKRISIQGFDHDFRRIIDKLAEESELSEYVGEELAAKFNAMAWKPYNVEQSDGRMVVHDSKVLQGLDLKVGGKGMIGAYDKILPAEIGRYVKQWGAKVEKGAVKTGTPRHHRYAIIDATDTPQPGYLETFRTLKEAEEAIKKYDGGVRIEYIEGDDIGIWQIQITPQMRESIQTQGQPLFMAGPRHESPQAANEMLERMMAELPSAEELEVLRAMAHKESNGNRSIGVPEKANISKNEKVRVEYEVIKQIQSGDIAPEKVQEWLDEGRKMARNEDDVANQVMSNYFNGAGFDSPELVFASALVTARKFKRAQQSNDPVAMREAQALAYADGAGRTQTGRSLRAMADPHKSPHERAAEFIAKMIVTPSIKERNHIASAPSPFAKEKEIARLKAKLEALKQKIIDNEKAGVGHPTQEPLVKQHKAASAELAAKVREKDRKTLIEEYTEARHKAIVEALAREGVTEEDIFVSPEERLDAQESEPVREAMQQHPQEHQDAIRYIMRGYSHADISVMTGLTKDIVAGIHQDFRQKSLRGTLAKWVKKGNTLFDTIQNGIKYVFGQSMAAPAGQMMNKQPVIAAEAEIERQLAVLCPTAKQVNGGKFSVEVVNRKSGQEVTVKVPFSPTDFRQTYRVARAISTAQSSTFDKMYEWWIMGLLSGPETNVVNVLGNAASSGVHLLAQRPLETLWNLVFRDPESAQMGEWSHIMRGIMPGIRDAFTMAALAFDAEADPIGHRYLDETIDLNFDKAGQLAKVGTYRGPSIAGKKGRIIRIPGRALMAMDSFMKALMSNVEVGAQAYRLAKMAQARGAIANTPAELEAYIKTEVSTPGSNSWRLAMDTATELAFQDENWFSALAKHFTQRGLDARGFQKKAIDAAARGDSKTMHNMRRAANVLTFVEHAMRFIFPFVRTPTNILRMGVRKSPLGSVSLAAHIMLALGRGAYNWTGAKPFWTNQDRATLVKLFAEQTQAWFAVATLWSMIEGDDDDDDKKIILIGGRPSGTTSPGDRNEAYRNYGGTYVIIYRYPDGKEERFAFGRYEPIATALGTSIDAIREVKNMARLKRLGMEGGDATAALGNIIGSLMSQTEDKSFFQGYANLIKTIEAIRRGGDAPSDLGKGFLRQILQGIVPNIIRQPIRNVDPLTRDTKDKGDLLYSAVPFGDWAGPIIDYYGRESVKGGSSLSRLFFRSANEPLEKQPVEKWITRWNNNRPDDKFQPTDMKANDYWVYGPTGERRMIVDNKVKTDFERDVGAEILKRHNNYVATLQQSPNGKIVNSDSEDVDLKSRLTTIATEARKAVRQRFLKSPFDSVRNPVK